MLVVLCALVVVCFMLTRAAAAANRALRLRDAAAWYDAGEHHLAESETESAIRALRRATAINRDDRSYRLALAAALGAGHQDDAARQVLLGVREATPEDPEVNVRLARLESRRNDLTSTIRYYQIAVYGLWSGDREDARRQVRIELIRYLLAHDQRGRALSELLVLSSTLADDATSQVLGGQLFLVAGDSRRALDHFQRALRLDARNGAALAGGGEAAFELADYHRAQRYLRSAPVSERVSELRAITDLVLSRDPLQPGLSLGERQKRTVLDFRHAVDVLHDCIARGTPATQETLDSLRAEARALEPTLTAAKLRGSPDSIETGLNVIYRIEQQTVAACGPASATDRALVLIGRRHEADRP